MVTKQFSSGRYAVRLYVLAKTEAEKEKPTTPAPRTATKTTDEERQDEIRRLEHANPADPAIPEDQLDEAARSGNHTSTITPGVQIRSRGWIGASQPPARHPGDIHQL
ncbi:hypothetical protein Trydic_g16451 [Trypoxylus dichotomus]